MSGAADKNAKQRTPPDRELAVLRGCSTDEQDRNEGDQAGVPSATVYNDEVKKKSSKSVGCSTKKASAHKNREKTASAEEAIGIAGAAVAAIAERHASQPGATRVYPQDWQADDASGTSDDCPSEDVSPATSALSGVRRGTAIIAQVSDTTWIAVDQQGFDTVLIGEAITSGESHVCVTAASAGTLAASHATLHNEDEAVVVQAVNGIFIKRRRIVSVLIGSIFVTCVIAVVIWRTWSPDQPPPVPVSGFHLPAALEKIVLSLPTYTQKTLRRELPLSTRNNEWYKNDIWSPKNSFEPVSSQGKAWKWLMSDPNLQSRDSRDIVYRFALATFYYATNGTGWRNNTNWLSLTEDICTWWHDSDTSYNERPGYYEYCRTVGFTALIIPGNNLRGTIPPELSLISSLTLVKLYSNSLSGTIPDDVWRSWKAAYAIKLENNYFIGTLPAAIGEFSRLLYFLVDFNSFSGTLPTEVGTLTGLRQLIVSNNRLEGKIPTEVGRLQPSAGFIFDTANNMLTGRIPTELSKISKLRYFDVRNNGLSGSIPSQLGSCNNLYFIYTSNNHLTGTIPTEFGHLSGLVILDLSNNNLKGTLPSQLGLLTGLASMDIANNGLHGSLPSEFGQLVELTSLRLSYTRITGVIPDSLCLALLPENGINEIVVDCNRVQCNCNCTCE